MLRPYSFVSPFCYTQFEMLLITLGYERIREAEALTALGFEYTVEADGINLFCKVKCLDQMDG